MIAQGDNNTTTTATEAPQPAVCGMRPHHHSRGRAHKMVHRRGPHISVIFQVPATYTAPAHPRQMRQLYATQLTQLKEAGYPPSVGLLKKFDGDLDQVKAAVDERRSKKLQNRPFASQVEQLKAQGYPPCVGLLKKFDGDLDQVKAAVDERRSKKLQNRPFASQVEQLKAQGYPACVGLLKKFDGDVDKTIEAIQKRREGKGNNRKNGNSPQKLTKEERMKMRMMKRAQRIHRHPEPEPEPKPTEVTEESPSYTNELTALKDAGFVNEARCLKLLNKFNGDVERVKQTILKIRQMKMAQRNKPTVDESDFQEQLTELKQAGFTNQVRCVKLLTRFNGDVEQVKQTIMEARNRRGANNSATPVPVPAQETSPIASEDISATEQLPVTDANNKQALKEARKQAKMEKFQARKAMQELKRQKMQARRAAHAEKRALHQAAKASHNTTPVSTTH